MERLQINEDLVREKFTDISQALFLTDLEKYMQEVSAFLA
jgi:hypothetical protein